MMYDGMHEASPDEVAKRMGGGDWDRVVQTLMEAGASILLPDPPREAVLTEHDGTVTNWIEVNQDDALHRVCIRSLNDADYVVIKRADGEPGNHGFITANKQKAKGKT